MITNLSREIETIKIDKIEILELKNSICEIKMSLGQLKAEWK